MKELDSNQTQQSCPVSCGCEEKYWDILLYGSHWCKDGKRISPWEVYVDLTDTS